MTNSEFTNDFTEENVNEENLLNYDSAGVVDICRIQKISRQTLYNRLDYLQIKPWKKGNTNYFDKQQLEYLHNLNEHYLQYNSFDNFPVPEKTGPWEEKTEESSAIASADKSELQNQNPPELKQQPASMAISSADIQDIKLAAQQRVKAKRLAILEVTRAYEENPDLLPSEILNEIEEAEQSYIATPMSQRNYYDPKALAQLALKEL